MDFRRPHSIGTPTLNLSLSCILGLNPDSCIPQTDMTHHGLAGELSMKSKVEEKEREEQEKKTLHSKRGWPQVRNQPLFFV